MKNELIKVSVVNLVLGIMAFSPMPVVEAAIVAQFNVSATDLPILQVTNATKYPYSTVNWAKTVYVDPGDSLDFIIFYHNVSGVAALNTRLKLNLPFLISSGNTIAASIFADNAFTTDGVVNVYLNSGNNLALNFVPGSAKWYIGNPAVLRSIPFGQSGDEVVAPSGGIRLGDVAAGDSGYVILRTQISGNSQITPSVQGSAPFITTNLASNVSATGATLSGSAVAGTLTSAWFEYGPTQSLGSTTATFQIGTGNLPISYSANVSNLLPNITYYYRATAQNSYGVSRGSILSFSTQPDELLKSASSKSDLKNLSNSLAQLNSSLSRIKVASNGEVDSPMSGDLASIHFSIDKKDLKAGDEVNFTAEVVPLANLRSTSLQIKFPSQFDFESTTASSYAKDGNILTFNLGTIPVGNAQIFKLKAALGDSFKKYDIKDGKLVGAAILSYSDGIGSVKAPVSSLVEMNVAPVGFLTSILDAFSFPGSIWALLILLFVGFVMVIVAKRLLN